MTPTVYTESLKGLPVMLGFIGELKDRFVTQ